MRDEHDYELEMLLSDHSDKLVMELNKLRLQLQSEHQQQLERIDSEHLEKLNAEKIKLSSRIKGLEETYQQKLEMVTTEHAQKIKEEREQVMMEFRVGRYYVDEDATTEHAQEIETKNTKRSCEDKELEGMHSELQEDAQKQGARHVSSPLETNGLLTERILDTHQQELGRMVSDHTQVVRDNTIVLCIVNQHPCVLMDNYMNSNFPGCDWG